MNALTQEIDVRRMQALRSRAAFDASPEREYDDIVFLASLVCNAPIALIGMLDSEREWFKARVGLQAMEVRAEHSFCRYALSQPLCRPDALFVIPDALADPRFAGNPWVTSDPRIRFYAAVPLRSADGCAFGALAVLDCEPRRLTEAQRQGLAMLGRQAIAKLDREALISELQENERRFRAFMDNGPVLASLKDESGRYIYVNRPFLLRCGLCLSDILGKTDSELWPEDVARQVGQSDLELLERGGTVSEIESGVSADGEKSYWQVTRFVLHGKQRLLGGMGLDITKAKRYEAQLMKYQQELQCTLERLEVLSTTDSLTEIHNRRAFDDRLKEEFERARRYNLPLSLLLIDVDNFKALNDSLGHTEGDALLHAVALMLKENARANDVAARYGGDEFAVILPNTSAMVAFKLAERLRRSARELAFQSFQVTLSIGVASLAGDMMERTKLVVAADRALYDAKRKGRDQVSCLF